ncbi:type II toxin-antitoxin system RelE/ParE family toxin [uncultured Maricaulis sp.]|uniref:type II toxin-antitoxin system RelE/ParE family toxin n=1 Tax=uncultured Maricaulis sp. TaxID=174710 RepID=UPI0030DB93F2|tara:strand:- start:196984 stop:197265 length:282 start_codon:yes stop_codon:yes gene_type:complete
MIRSWADKRTRQVFEGQVPKGFPAELAARTRRLLERIHAAHAVRDLRFPPSHRLHRLTGDQAGRWSVSVNDQFRVTFAFRGNDAHEVRFEDYH